MFKTQPIFDKTLAMNTTLAANCTTPLESTSRRSFIRYLTASATAIAVQGCGGGGGTAPSTAAAPVAPTAPVAVVPPVTSTAPGTPVPTPAAPVILTIPDIAFVEGMPSSFSVASYISAENVAAFSLSLNAMPLPAGVTFNAVNRSFDYDGVGTPADTTGHILTATGA